MFLVSDSKTEVRQSARLSNSSLLGSTKTQDTTEHSKFYLKQTPRALNSSSVVFSGRS